MKKSVLFGVMFVSTVLLANPYKSKQEEIDAVKAIGQKASAALLKTLGGNLKKHLKAGGPMDALEFCSTNAYPLTHDVDTSLGKNVSIKRVSLLTRNPANAPLADEAPVIDALQTMSKNNVVMPAEIVQDLGQGKYKYYKPLLINKKACLLCHGDIKNGNPKLFAAIKKNYPDDRATGYKMNDLRGAIVVDVQQ